MSLDDARLKRDEEIARAASFQPALYAKPAAASGICYQRAAMECRWRFPLGLEVHWTHRDNMHPAHTLEYIAEIRRLREQAVLLREELDEALEE